MRFASFALTGGLVVAYCLVRHPLSRTRRRGRGSGSRFTTAPGVYLFNPFDHKPESGVWQALVTEGLTPARVAEKAKGVTVPDCTDSVE